MKKTSDLSDHIKRTMPKRDIQEGRESVQMFVEMLKHHKIDVVDDEVLNRTYETEDYVDEKILSLILETLKIDEPIQYIPRYMRSMNAFQAGGTTVVVVDELLEYCANSSCVKECFFRRSRTFSPNFMFATFLWRSYRAVTMCNGICKYSI